MSRQKADDRQFSPSDRERKYQEQGGVCGGCGGAFPLNELSAHHSVPYGFGGSTDYANLGGLYCKHCHGVADWLTTTGYMDDPHNTSLDRASPEQIRDPALFQEQVPIAKRRGDNPQYGRKFVQNHIVQLWFEMYSSEHDSAELPNKWDNEAVIAWLKQNHPEVFE